MLSSICEGFSVIQVVTLKEESVCACVKLKLYSV